MTTHWVDAMRRADFDIVSQRNLGGTLLGPLFANGAILPDMAEHAANENIPVRLNR